MSQVSREKRIPRQGIQALYTFTPFKLLRAQAEAAYSLILVPVAYQEVTPSLRWRSRSCKDAFRIPVTEQFSKKVVQPHEIYAQNFSKDRPNKFIYRVSESKLKEEGAWRWPPVYMEFSWEALNASYFCSLGWVASSSQPLCPLTKECKFFKPTKRRGLCIYYRGPIAYSSLYNVYPRILRRFEDPVAGFIYKPVLAIRFGDYPLAIIRFTDQGSFLAYIDGVVFSPKISWMRTPMLFTKEGIGFKITDVNAIVIEFVPEILHAFIYKQLESNKDLASWIILKQELFMETETQDGYIRERRGFTAFRTLDQIVIQAIQGVQEPEEKERVRKILNRIKKSEFDESTIDFACVLFLHSLAHTLKNLLVARYGCRSEDISYYIEHPRLRVVGVPSEKIRIIIFETAMGGFGYIKNFVQEVRSSEKGENLEALLESAKNSFQRYCETRADRSMKTLEKELGKYRDEYAKFIDPIITGYHKSFPGTGLYPHVNSLRRALTSVLERIPDEIRPLLDDFIEKGPYCWDGCQLCVMLERECNFLPFDQPFLVSERLLRNSLEIICSAMKNPISFSPLRKGIMKEFETFISVASNKIDLVTPWISPEIIDSLLRLVVRKHLRVRVITKEDRENEVQVQSLKKLAQATKSYVPNFEARILDQLHAKGMLVDDIMLLHGSFNFTLSGLNSNVENATMDFSVIGTKRFGKEFEDLWKTARPISEKG